ncbi:uncharacterized protein F4807DRAFT_437534 [Annulohypoxylon truncatum]|uniref:uncharacterized protein n=1 Tax=Annulohypoxylon truncatum TaxID=327061 RepID=UPI0020083356|nr:uncharacterized protein F4807DRAFT_437534 [Annulohypoxylon truncatum]KAI1206873.1 hypothetical protein F4807DRAFT_437534 [Annulohypoxylon truncatum]
MDSQRYTTKAILATFLSVASLVSAAPFEARGAIGSSAGFRLIATVVDSSKKLSVPIEGAALQGAHVGAGLNTAVLNATTAGQIFYQNGTTEDVRAGKSNILTDEGTPLYPYGLGLPLNETDPTSPVVASINGGSGTLGVSLEATTSLTPGVLHYGIAGFMACDEALAYYGPSWKFAVVKAFETTKEAPVIPENCVQINLHPLCATLPTLPAGSYSSHKFANEVFCYADAADIK